MSRTCANCEGISVGPEPNCLWCSAELPPMPAARPQAVAAPLLEWDESPLRDADRVHDEAGEERASSRPVGAPLWSVGVRRLQTPSVLRALLNVVCDGVVFGRLLESAPFDPSHLVLSDSDGVSLGAGEDAPSTRIDGQRYASPAAIEGNADPRQLTWGLGVFVWEVVNNRHAWLSLPADVLTPQDVDLRPVILRTTPVLTAQPPSAWPAERQDAAPWYEWHRLLRSLLQRDSRERWGATELAGWLQGSLPPAEHIGGVPFWNLRSWIDAVEAQPLAALAAMAARAAQWVAHFPPQLRETAVAVVSTADSAVVRLSGLLLLAGADRVLVTTETDRIESRPLAVDGRATAAWLQVLRSSFADRLRLELPEPRRSQFAALADALQVAGRVATIIDDAVWSVISLSSTERQTFAAAERRRLARAAAGTRLGQLLAQRTPLSDRDALELLVRILVATPADGLVTASDALATGRVEELRASGVPIDLSRIADWVRLEEPLPLAPISEAERRRARFISSPFPALARAHRSSEPTAVEMLLILAADNGASVWIERFAAGVPDPERARVRRAAEWEREMARLDREVDAAAAEFRRLLGRGSQ